MPVAKVSDGGRVVIPAELREKYGLAVGDTAIQAADSHGLTLYSQRAAGRRIQAIGARYKRPGVSEVDEFLRDKCKEAARE